MMVCQQSVVVYLLHSFISIHFTVMSMETISPASQGPVISASRDDTLDKTRERTNNFQFKSRKIGDNTITVVSLKLDPERGRRSAFIPDGEGFLLPASYEHLRHPHRFISPFEDEKQLLVNEILGYPEITNNSIQAIQGDKKPETDPVDRKEVIPKSQVGIKFPQNSQIGNGGIDLAVIDKEKLFELDEKSLNDILNAPFHTKKIRRKLKKWIRRKRRKERRRERRERLKRMRKRKEYMKAIAGRKRKARLKMIGDEACQYKMLRKCAKSLGLLPRKSLKNVNDIKKCFQRKRFLDCVEKKREEDLCRPRTVARGDLSGLRTWIKKVFWTSNSCLLNEATNGR